MRRERAQGPRQQTGTHEVYPVSLRIPEPAASLFTKMLHGYRVYRVGGRRHVESSVRADIGILCDLVNYCGKVPGQLTCDDFTRWGYHLAVGRRIALSTQRKYFASVRVFLEYVIGNINLRNEVRQAFGCDVIQLVTPETCIPHRVPREGEEDTNRRALLHNEVERLFDSMDRNIAMELVQPREKTLLPALRDKPLFFLVYIAGLRNAELTGLNVDSFEPNPDFPEFGRFGFVRVFGKGRKWRVVPIMHPQAPKLLEMYLTAVRPRLLKTSDTDPNERAFFLSERGRRMSGAGIRARFAKHLLDAGMADSGHVPHSLRHSMMTHTGLGTLDLESIRQLAGHVHASTTQHYFSVPSEYVREDIAAAIEVNLDKLGK